MKIISIVYEMLARPFEGVWDGNGYHDPSPRTPHMAIIRTSYPIAPVEKAYWRLNWSCDAPSIPNHENGLVRLYTLSPDTTAQKIPVAYIASSQMLNAGVGNVSNDAVDITDVFNAFIASGYAAGLDGEFGWDFSGDNYHTIKFWDCQIETLVAIS